MPQQEPPLWYRFKPGAAPRYSGLWADHSLQQLLLQCVIEVTSKTAFRTGTGTGDLPKTLSPATVQQRRAPNDAWSVHNKGTPGRLSRPLYTRICIFRDSQDLESLKLPMFPRVASSSLGRFSFGIKMHQEMRKLLRSLVGQGAAG